MSKSASIPRFEDSLASFLGDLRAWVFSSQSRAARHFGLSHTTISRYENGLLTPPAGYLVRLARLWAERLAGSAEDMAENQALMVREVNKALHWCYPDQKLFRDWSELVNDTETPLEAPAAPAAEIGRRFYWGEAPDVTVFFGRPAECAQLEHDIVADRCRLVAVLGLGGMGKTFLVTRVARTVAGHFEFVIWHSLRNAPPLEETIRLYLQILLGQTQVENLPQGRSGISRVISLLRRRRCLLVLDNLESIMAEGEENNIYRPGYEPYGDFIRYLGEIDHQSCLLLTSREKPGELDFLPDPGGKVRTVALQGINPDEGRQLLQNRLLTGTEQEWQSLVARYSGNPLALKLVADTISEVFGSQIGTFLKTEGLGFPGLRQLLENQFQRSAPLEQEVLYWLAVERKPVTLDELHQDMVRPRARAALVQALQRLRRRALIERSGDRFLLQNVVLEYVVHRLIGQLCDDILSERLALLQHVALLKAEAEDYVRQSQVRTILKPLAERLLDNLGPAALREKLSHLPARLRSEGRPWPGYAGGSLLNLMLHLGYDVRGADFSGLSVWQAFLRDAILPEVNFSEADLANSVFSNTFAGVDAIALSPDGRYLAVATGRRIHVWRLLNHELYTILEGHEDLVWAVAFAPDGVTLFSGSADQTVRAWDFHQGTAEKILRAHTHWVWSVVVSPDGLVAASAGADQAICTWDAQTGQLLNVLRGHAGPVRSLAFSPDGRVLASASHDQTVRLWDTRSGRLLGTMGGHSGEVRCITFSPDGEWLLSAGSDCALRLWQWRTGQTSSLLEGHTHTVSSVAINPDGNLAASGSYDGTIRLWDLKAARASHVLQAHRQSVRTITFDATGSLLVSGSYDQTVRFWEPRTGLLLHTIRGHTFQIRALAFSPDGEHLATCSTDYTVRLWHVQSGQLRHTLPGHSRWVAAAAYSPSGALLATGSYDRTVRLWQAQTGRLQRTLEGQNWIWVVAISPDGRLLAAAGADPVIYLWETETGQLRTRLQGHSGNLRSVAFSPDRRLLASSSDDQSIRLWHVETGETVGVLTGHEATVLLVAFAPDGHKLLSVSNDQTARLWDLASGQTEQVWTNLVGARQAVAVSPDGRWLACGSDDGWIYLTDMNSGQQLQRLGGQGMTISTLAFNPQGDTLASGSLNGAVRLWNLVSGACDQVLRISRPYEQMDITGATGLTEGQRAMLRALGAIENTTTHS
ncbi:MAG: NB-ARC domain-containing protein [Chloroflexi bacterium]|nr:NB-ARC domain-containing protein [Chloroflexota bacterium]MCI0577223.1 NB-ARC domain-containing protein [Chloroflexota bacterium]MCI0649410.1 NB-ARC domain-containing protein [Chloroflexota bacterium]MCI0729146.1 NB-ARC domain-containing protein [Chloroflexota bacterium]